MALTAVNTYDYTATTDELTHTVTLTTPTAGNLLVVIATNDAGFTATPCTSAPGTVALSAGPTNTGNCAIAMFYKIAAGTETSITVNVAGATATGNRIYIREYSGNSSTPLDLNQNATVTSATPATGLSATTAQGDELVIAAWGKDQTGAYSTLANQGTGSLSPTWTILSNAVSTAPSFNVTMLVGSAPVTSTGTIDAQITDAGGASVQSVILASFKASGGVVTAAIVNYARGPN